jgi:hypothetical protein
LCAAQAIPPTGKVFIHAVNVMETELLKWAISGRKLIIPLLKKADQGEFTSFLKSKSINFDN